MRIPYTSDRSACISVVLSWGLVFLIEGSVIATLILIFAPTPWLKLLLTGTLAGALTWFIAGLMLAPLRTAHLLTGDALELRYGRDRLTVPRQQIARAEAVDERLDPAYSSTFVWDETHGHIRAAFSRRGQIRLYLDPPLDTRHQDVPFVVREILINADDRNAVLNEWARRPTSTVETTQGQVTTAPVSSHDPMSVWPQPRIVPAPASNRSVAIETIGLTKMYGDSKAVDELNLAIRAGEIYGSIGPNGAGKTTTISMLVGLLRPTRGIIRLAGRDLMLAPVAAKQALGYGPDRPVLYDTLTGREFLQFNAQLRGISLPEATRRIAGLLDTLDLRHQADQLCRTYSFGMRNKLSLAAALLHQPRVLVLDEPFNGLDPQSAHKLRTLLIELASGGTGILLSTHDLAAVERICHRVGIIAGGRLIAEGDPESIRARAVGTGVADLEAAFLSLTRSPSETPAP